MNVFALRNQLIADYSSYISSFIHIRNERIRAKVDQELQRGLLWPDPLIQLNPAFAPGKLIDELVEEGLLHQECGKIFRKDKDKSGLGAPLRLHRHQEEAIRAARLGENYVLTTGTGSGKSMTYIVPIVDHVLRRGSGKGTQAIVVYPMNALANSQIGELEKFLFAGYPQGHPPVTFRRYTGQESDEDKQAIMADPPDILLTNYVMLELILTRPEERKTLINAAHGARFLVLDELHTYRGRQGGDVAMLVRRVRDALSASDLQCVGTSATMAGGGDQKEQQAQVAEVASLLFGSPVKPENIIGETLRRSTLEIDFNTETDKRRLLQQFVAQPEPDFPHKFQKLVDLPLSAWIESVFGVTMEEQSSRLKRASPRSIGGEEGAARDLHRLTGVDEAQCARVLEKAFLVSYQAEPNPETGLPVFAFRLHQFISRGDTVFASPEMGEKRYVTVHGQQFVPGDRQRVLLPLVFCAECGQEYYSVYKTEDEETGLEIYTARAFNENIDQENGTAGFLYLCEDDPWPIDTDAVLEQLPEDWMEEHKGLMRLRSKRRAHLPQSIQIASNGVVGDGANSCESGHFVEAPFRFCLHCGVSYNFRQRSDFGKLSSLGAGGRSTATTILAISTIRQLNRETNLSQVARKLLSFTDNRQDASLQAGHFNDFIEISVLRSALYRAARDSGTEGFSSEELTGRVFNALDLPLEAFTGKQELKRHALIEAEKALRDVLGYRFFHDLRRGWRITSPNLEQCGLLEIQYPYLDELCKDEDSWQDCHTALVSASPQTRERILKVLLDYMRRELAIKVDYLDPGYQEKVQQRSNLQLIPPWALDENEKMEYASILFPRSRGQREETRNMVYASARGGFGQFLRRIATFPEHVEGKLSTEDTELVIRQILDVLSKDGFVDQVVESKDEEDVPGYQIMSNTMRWVAGDGARAYHDPIRVPNEAEGGSRTNAFFVRFYQTIAGELQGLEAREHTAQVPYAEREEREDAFREGRLPVLFCSPTMELGIDIALLNVVNLRNVPPTPANYAQRSGRAGRSGQPALVFTYCSIGSPHDQHFFQRSEDMVSGAVTPPRLDLANEDLIRAHVHAIWLAETGLRLEASLRALLDLSGEELALNLLPWVQDSIGSQSARQRATNRAQAVLTSVQSEIETTEWYRSEWLPEVLARAADNLNRSCERWRGLYRAAYRQSQLQGKIILDHSRSAKDKERARRLRAEAESQIELLADTRNVVQSDFYSYRYFASEGFLPGYNFPRLPLSAFIPARRSVKGKRDEFLSRPRFLAISEFGPRAIIYHEGSRYITHKVIMPLREAEEGSEAVMTGQAKLCPICGYLHPVSAEANPDICESCGKPLSEPLRPLFRLQNVSTRRRDRINSDEEERMRMGYELITGYRFALSQGMPVFKTAGISVNGKPLMSLAYGSSATLWRINLGWRRRKDKEQFGFVLDTERGVWARNEREEEEITDESSEISPSALRVIPYVEDTRNCLVFTSELEMEPAEMATLMAALKNAIQVTFQLEDNELAAEPLPSREDRRQIILYEAAEGGAGVLRRLAEDAGALGRVAEQALHLCHFDPHTGEDLRRADRAKEDCEAACYNCLMSYTNQLDHRLLDRHLVRDLLIDLRDAEVSLSPAHLTRQQHLRTLRNLCQSDLEREWLDFVEEHQCHLPSRAQALIESCGTRPDFIYDDRGLLCAIYIDGYHHLHEDRQVRDREKTNCLEDRGYEVLRFGLLNDWLKLVEHNPHIFGIPENK